jgi:predicted DNA-binding protein
MSNVTHIKDWLARHADVSDCERALSLSDESIEAAIRDCDDILLAADVLFNILNTQRKEAIYGQ